MPVIKSAQKRMRQEAVRRTRNRRVKSEMRTDIKSFMKALGGKDKTQAAEALRLAQGQLSRAVKKHLVHKNTAARTLSRLTALAKNAGVKPVTTKKSPATKAPAKKTSAKRPTAAAGRPATKKTTQPT